MSRNGWILACVAVVCGVLAAFAPAVTGQTINPTCVFSYLGDFCSSDFIEGFGEEPVPITEEVASGSTASGAAVGWHVGLSVGALAAVDQGNYVQNWKVYYHGDRECREVSNANWEGSGTVVAGAYTFQWQGGTSDAGGAVSPSYDSIRQHVIVAKDIHTRADGNARCDLAFGLDRTATELVVTGDAELSFGTFANELGLATWTPLSVATCSTGTIVTVGVPLSGTIGHTIFGGNVGSGYFSIDGGSDVLGVPVEWHGQGNLGVCAFLDLPDP